MDDLKNVGTETLIRWLKTLIEISDIGDDMTICHTMAEIRAELAGRE